ncbi:hypothetical protein [Qipengyuania sediminis]|uniref:hypothetical protein n=1 Tax=Qipengyuania sediminis TaxID=1532023 RepID=UPI0010598981|nr:hypothetical protein [Qipengyuania sediminis]
MAEPPAEPPRPGGDPARARYWFIAGHRILGAVLVMLGMLAMEGALAWGRDLGKVLAAAGLVVFFLLPLVFARMWRSVPK